MPTETIEPASEDALAFNEDAYKTHGLAAQRSYPNEELCRFMGRNYFPLSKPSRAATRILELGCGTGANLWMMAAEGFDAYGIDFSPSAIELARQNLGARGLTARLDVADMTRLPYEGLMFDAVIEVFSSYAIDTASFRRTVAEVRRVLKPGGRFFAYTPGKGSDAWHDFAPADKLDDNTLRELTRPTAPFAPYPGPFRFMSHQELADELAQHGLTVEYAESLTRTYRQGQEVFEFLVIEARSI